MTRIFDLEQELDAALTALALVKSENARLREALGSLSNEASGLLRVHEFALSMDGGNSNMQVLRIRLEEARAALEEK